MARRALICSILAVFACVLLTGCMPHHMTVEQMKAEMPARPAALDRLDAFVGRWQYEGETKFAMLDEPLKTTGTGEYNWDGNKWYMVGRETMNMEHFEPTQMLETWTYDIHDKKYRSTFVDSIGEIGVGESTYNEETDTWHVKAKGHSPWGGFWMKGWMKCTGPDTMKWGMTEYQGLMKIMEMSGTAKRVK